MARDPVKIHHQQVTETSEQFYGHNNNFFIRHATLFLGICGVLLVVTIVLFSLGVTGNLSSEESMKPDYGKGNASQHPVIIRSTEKPTPPPTTTPPPTPAPLPEIPPNDRLRCHPQDETTNAAGILPGEQTCLNSRRCKYSLDSDPKVPRCFLPVGQLGYQVQKAASSGGAVEVYNLTPRDTHRTQYSTAFQLPRLTVERMTGSVLRFKFDDANVSRYEVPVPLQRLAPTTGEPLYTVDVPATGNISEMKIQRATTKVAIWDMSIGGLFLENQFLQISTRLPTMNVYGFGDNRHPSLKHRFDWRAWPMFSRDQDTRAANAVNNLYGVHPFYMCIEEDGSAHGVLFFNSNAMEYVLQPAPALTLRSIGGVLDFYVFMGPTPEQVIQQYTELLGRTFIPPYWALGFQISRWGFKNLDEVKGVVQRNLDAGVPLEAVYGDIDYMRYSQDFTYDNVTYAGLPGYIDELHSKNMKYVIILDPAIHVDSDRLHPQDPENRGYLQGVAQDVFVKWPAAGAEGTTAAQRALSTGVNGAILGKVWPEGRTAFPDFFKPSAKQWWKQMIGETYNEVGLKFDALWIDMNEPASWHTNKPYPDCSASMPNGQYRCYSLQCNSTHPLNTPAYRPAAMRIYGTTTRLSDRTICMSAQHEVNGVLRDHYDVHSLYGWSQAQVTYEAAQMTTGSRSFVFSRSTYPGAQKHAGHWLGDNGSNYPELHHSIIGLLEYSIFGFAYVGADICGFGDNTTAALCQKWTAAGAFYPFARNHNAIGTSDQDPASLPGVVDVARKAFAIRYTFLPYLYTLFYRAHRYGDTVSRPLHHIYPTDGRSLDTDDEFFWGSALLISPIVNEENSRQVYIPPNDSYFDYYTGSRVASGNTTFTWGERVIALHLRGGQIIPTQDFAVTTTDCRRNPFRLIVVIDQNKRISEGELFWDDSDRIGTFENGEYYHASFQYDVNERKFTYIVNHNNIPAEIIPSLAEIKFYSAPRLSAASFVLAEYPTISANIVNDNEITRVTFSSSVPMTTSFSGVLGLN